MRVSMDEAIAGKSGADACEGRRSLRNDVGGGWSQIPSRPALYPRAFSRADFILGYTDFRVETPILEGKMQEFPKSDRPSKGGRRPFVPTRRQRDKVTLLIAAGFPEPAIAIAIGCCQNTLRRYFATELQNGRVLRRLENLLRLERQAAAGSVGAMRILEGIFCRAENKQLQVKGKAEARPSKRVLAQRAAAAAGGVGSGWGDDLAWSSGGRPQ